MHYPIIMGLNFYCMGLMSSKLIEQEKELDILKKKHKKSKKKAKKNKKLADKYLQDLKRPIYKRTILPRNAKTLSQNKPKYPIGFY